MGPKNGTNEHSIVKLLKFELTTTMNSSSKIILLHQIPFHCFFFSGLEQLVCEKSNNSMLGELE